MTDRTRGLGGYIAERRRQLGLSQSRAATKAGVSRTSWVAWEKGTATPEDYNHVKIERALQWQPGSVDAILAGGDPTPIQMAKPPLTKQQLAVRRAYEEWRRDHGPKIAMRMLREEVDRLNA